MLASTPARKRMRFDSPKQTPLDKKCQELGISPPRYETLNSGIRKEYMALEDIEQQIALGDFGGFCDDKRKEAVLIFLYGRKYLSNYKPETRKRHILEILNDEEAIERAFKVAALGGDRNMMDNAKEALLESAPAGEGKRTNTSESYDLWIDLVQDLSQCDGFYTVFNMCKEFNFKLVLRQQCSSNCFMHAAAVLQGYLVQMGTKRFSGMIDMSKFVRDCADDELITKLILTNDGGSSLEMLITFTSTSAQPPGVLTIFSVRKDAVKEIVESFNKYGPAMVTNCKLDKNFLRHTQVSSKNPDPYDLYEIPEFDDYEMVHGRDTHAMVLIGYCYDGDGYQFLLQNWWKDMQFCLVGQNYLIQSKARVHFVTNKLVDFGDECTTTFLQAEAQFHDRSDGFFAKDDPSL